MKIGPHVRKGSSDAGVRASGVRGAWGAGSSRECLDKESILFFTMFRVLIFSR